MRHLQTYRLFESAQTLTQDQKDFLDKYTKGGSWSLNPSTGLVDLQGDFDCSREGLNDLLGIRFGKAPWNFYCNGNNLTSLEGAPQTVGGDFYCSDNSLQTLEGAPQTVGGDFSCNKNKLTTIEGAPQIVNGAFYCSGNMLTSLTGAPQTVGGEFGCTDNKLTSLEGAPQTVGGDFSCYNNRLTSLAGAPETVKGGFSSDSLKIPKGKWSMDTLIGIFLTGTPQQKQLVAPLVDPKVIQQQIDENPEGMLIKLKGYLKHPHFQGLKWPRHLDQEKDLLSDLGDVGL
jgi:hypothetical protein